jgi:D-glycero-D-manno-heptose 1,7-bisphosphate phosphatase
MDTSSPPQRIVEWRKIQYVFLDRDGVINRKAPEGQYVSDPDEFELLAGVEEAILVLNASGRRVIVVSNQRGVALGLYTASQVDSLHSKLQSHLIKTGAHIDAFYYCPHDREQCDCRKPKTGLFRMGFRDFPAANPANSVVIGDSLSDMEAAQSLGAPSIFIEGPAETQKPGAERAISLAQAVFPSLISAVQALVHQQ